MSRLKRARDLFVAVSARYDAEMAKYPLTEGPSAALTAEMADARSEWDSAREEEFAAIREGREIDPCVGCGRDRAGIPPLEECPFCGWT
jgi:rubrerythrin